MKFRFFILAALFLVVFSPTGCSLPAQLQSASYCDQVASVIAEVGRIACSSLSNNTNPQKISSNGLLHCKTSVILGDTVNFQSQILPTGYIKVEWESSMGKRGTLTMDIVQAQNTF